MGNYHNNRIKTDYCKRCNMVYIINPISVGYHTGDKCKKASTYVRKDDKTKARAILERNFKKQRLLVY